MLQKLKKPGDPGFGRAPEKSPTNKAKEALAKAQQALKSADQTLSDYDEKEERKKREKVKQQPRTWDDSCVC